MQPADAARPAPRAKGSLLERWLAIALRSAHLVGVVWLGAAVVAGQAPRPQPALLMAASGLAMLWLDLAARRLSLRELAGAFVILKLALVAWMAADPTQARWIFWLLLVVSSVTAHAPKDVRHWPSAPP